MYTFIRLKKDGTVEIGERREKNARQVPVKATVQAFTGRPKGSGQELRQAIAMACERYEEARKRADEQRGGS